jgi:dTDP-4-amino-4,6-dideoxygalactose transaminase
MSDFSIPFNKPFLTGHEVTNIQQAYVNCQLAGDGPFTKKCTEWLESNVGCKRALLTHSCTAALEMAAILADIQEGDEVIMPSYTFVSTANAFVLRGGIPVFVDVRRDTLNIDETRIEAAITTKTKAIVAVHYAGVSCEMDTIMAIASRFNILVIEDAAQGVMSTYKGRPLGSIGHLGCYSFHETKNIISGEGGALLVNDEELVSRAEIIREKGTNRSGFFRGEVSKYTWMDIGSSYLPGEITAAFLLAQMMEARQITSRRLAIWDQYNSAFKTIAKSSLVSLPTVPNKIDHNAHMFYILLNDNESRDKFIHEMKLVNIACVFHYVPLHSSPQGLKSGRCFGALDVTADIASRLVRLPLWLGLEDDHDYVIKSAIRIIGSLDCIN